jgi:hypothetical protein
MYVWRPTDWDEMKLFVQPHVEMLAEQWRPRMANERPDTEPRHHLHIRPRHHHHFHLPLHAAHS